MLLENHSYVRLLPPTSPHYFCVVRVAQKHPCIVLHVNHIEGTPYSVRKKILDDMKQSIAALQMSLDSQASQLVVVTPNRKKSSVSLPKMSCATILTKQLHRVFIR